MNKLDQLLESVHNPEEVTEKEPERKTYFYHITDQKLEPGTVWGPRVPDSYIIQKNLEDNQTPRICFGTTILGALKGISGAEINGKTLHVYVPGNYGSLEIHYPTNDEVPDAEDLGEVWILNDVELVHVGTIKITGHEVIDTEYQDRIIKRDDYGYEWVGGKNIAMIAPEDQIDRKIG